MDKTRKKQNRQGGGETAAGFLAGIGAAAVFLFLFFGLRWNFFLCAALAVVLFAAFSLLFKPARKIGRVEISAVSGGEELYRKLQEAKEDLDSIGRSMEQIEDVQIRSQSQRLHETASSILSYLEKHPEKIGTARRFIDYYQDTASSLLAKYVELERSGLHTEDAAQLEEKTKKALQALHQAFEGQFERLMRNELMDMDAELKLLEQTMKMEGPL